MISLTEICEELASVEQRMGVIQMKDDKIQEHDPRLGDHEAEWRAVDDAVDKMLIELNRRGWDLQRLITHWHDLRRNGHVEVGDGQDRS